MSNVYSFAPIVRKGCTRLILGSMPGKVSLEKNQYYGHPQNYFWKFMEELLGISRELDYETRCQQITEHGIAVWDVLKACTRPGSLDSDIVTSSIGPNDFDSFFRRYPTIEAVYFNGTKAEQTYRRHVLPVVSAEFAELPMTRLPSTSPANASIPRDRKLELWKVITSQPG